jgi:peptide/nickel transport system permease protein
MLDVRADAESIAKLREELGLNDPLPVQYYNFIARLVRGNLGRSFRTNRPVIDEIKPRLWPTVQLAVAGMAGAVVLGGVAGVVAAARRDTWLDSVMMVVAMLGVSIPSFLSGMIGILVFSVYLGWLPSMGHGTIRHLILPAMSLAVLYSAVIARLVRASMIEILNTDYVRTARAKGLPERQTLYKHALRNGLIPVITVVGIYFGLLLGGTFVVETLFSWPGIGRLAVVAILNRDFPVIQGVVLFVAGGLVFVNLVVDLTYGFLDPRIRYN